MKGNNEKKSAIIETRERKISRPIRWNHTVKIASTVAQGTKEASLNTRSYSDKIIKVIDGNLIEENLKNGEIKTIKKLETVSIKSPRITLNTQKSK